MQQVPAVGARYAPGSPPMQQVSPWMHPAHPLSRPVTVRRVDGTPELQHGGTSSLGPSAWCRPGRQPWLLIVGILMASSPPPAPCRRQRPPCNQGRLTERQSDIMAHRQSFESLRNNVVQVARNLRVGIVCWKREKQPI
jgi:hypothetical protein